MSYGYLYDRHEQWQIIEYSAGPRQIIWLSPSFTFSTFRIIIWSLKAQSVIREIAFRIITHSIWHDYMVFEIILNSFSYHISNYLSIYCNTDMRHRYLMLLHYSRLFSCHLINCNTNAHLKVLCIARPFIWHNMIWFPYQERKMAKASYQADDMQKSFLKYAKISDEESSSYYRKRCFFLSLII